MSDLHLEDGEVTVTGKAGGHPVTISGKIKNVKLKAETTNDYNRYFLSKDTSYFMEFLSDESGVAYTYQYEMLKIERRATVEVDSFTMEELEAARAATGAPRDAQIMFDRGTSRELIFLSGGGNVTFIWTEEKIK